MVTTRPGRRVLAISAWPNSGLGPERLRRLVQQLEASGTEVDAVAELASLSGDVLPHRHVFLDWDGSPDVLKAILPRLRSKAQLVSIVPQASLAALTELLADPRCNHVLVGDEADRGIGVTAQKLTTGDIFGIEKYLPPGTEVNYCRLRDFQGRNAAIETILKFAEAKGVRRQIRSAIGQVCEELLMNALYDAPIDEHGNQVFAEIDPHARVDLQTPRPVSIRYAATDTQFAIAVRDRFGRLAKPTILAYINKCLHSSQQIDRKTYGAGLGLYLVANAAAGYVVNVAHGMATEVVCTFDRGSKAPLRLVGVFVHPGQAAVPATVLPSGGGTLPGIGPGGADAA